MVENEDELIRENGNGRISSTTSGISSDGSSTSIISCCNNNEECRFKNSTKRYFSYLYPKDCSKNYGKHLANDNSNKDRTDTLTSKSSYESHESDCSFCFCNNNRDGDYQKEVDKNLSSNTKRDINMDIDKKFHYGAKSIGTKRLFLEKM